MIDVQAEIDAEADLDLPDPPENDRGPGAWLNLPEDFRDRVAERFELGMFARVVQDRHAAIRALDTASYVRGRAQTARRAREARERAEDQKRRAGRATLADYGLSRSTTGRGRS